MSSEDREKSWEQGAPVEYYEFVVGTTFYRYNTSDRALVLNGETYVPLSVTRENIQHGVERNRLALTVVIPVSTELDDLWHPYPTSAVVGLTIYAGHLGETDALVVWIGRVISPKFTPTTLTLTGEPSTTTSRKSGQAQCWQRGCMHVLYKQGDGLCNAVKATFAAAATLTSVAGATLQAEAFATFPVGRLAGGYIEWTNASGTVERRSIDKHDTANTILLYYPAADLAVASVVTVYPGCKHTYEDCDTYFNNHENYGGDLYAPERSPFNGNPVF